MERILLITPAVVTGENARALMERSELVRLRCPDRFDGWYVSGVCCLRAGRKRDARYYLSMAYGITPEPVVERLMRVVGGDVSRAGMYRTLRRIRRGGRIAVTVLMFVALSAAAFLAATR